MFPTLSIWPFFDIYTFGLCMMVAWAVFFWFLHRFSLENGITKNVFSDVVSFTLSIFFFSRVVYIFTEWRNEKYIFIDLIEWQGVLHFLRQFFITDNYHLSLAWGIFGFFLVLFWKIRKKPHLMEKYLDTVVRAFLMAAPIGYFGALLGGQLYGIPFDSLFSIAYTNKESIVPGDVSRFPLPVIYVLSIVWLVFFLRKLATKDNIPSGLIAYAGMGIYGAIVFLFEFLNSSSDMFSSFPPYLSLNQLVGCLFILIGFLWILRNIKP